MDLGTMLYNNLKDVTWSTTVLPLDQLVSAYRLPQIVKLDHGEQVEGLRDNDYLLIHSCRQWTTITAHSLEEGHYVIGPKIEIPVHYEGQFKLLEQDRDVAEPVQYFNSVEEVAKAFPERVYVMEEITFNVKMASGECNEDTEVYNITLSTGDELTLMGQAEILYAKTSRERSRFNTIFKRIGKLNSIIRLSRGKMPCLICMNHRTNESVSLPFQCKGRFSTCSPLELQMQEGEHTIRDIVEKTRLPVNVAVPRGPPRNPHDLHAIREGHRYKLVNAQTRTVVVCCVLRSNKIAPVHFPLHAAPAAAAMPRVILPEGMLQGELWLDTMVHRWLTFCQEHFDIDDYSRAVRDVRADWDGDDGGGGGRGKSHKRSSYNGVPTNTGGGTNGCPAHGHHVPSSLTYARDELTQSFHRLSVCVYGGNLHGNSEVNLQGCVALCRDWALLPSDCLPPGGGEPDYLPPEPPESAAGRPPSPPLPPPPPPPPVRGGVAYEELWLDQLQEQRRREAGRCCRGNRPCPGGEGASLRHGSSSSSAGQPLGPLADRSLSPPPVPPKSEAVKEECRLLNAPPIPPRSSKQTPTMLPILCKTQQQEMRSQSPTLSYYSSGLHNIGGCESEATELEEQSSVCNPCSWIKASEPCPIELCRSLPTDGSASRLSWPNTSSGGGSFRGTEDLVPPGCRSYYSYPRKRPLGCSKTCGATTSLYDFDGREHTCRGVGGGGDLRLNKAPVNPFGTKSSSYTLETYRDEPTEELNAKQSLSCPVLPPRTPKSNVVKTGRADSPAAETADSPTAGRADSLTMGPADSPTAGRELPPRPLSQQERSPGDAPASVTPSCPPAAPQGQWKPPSSLGGLSIEEVSWSLRFIGLPDDVGALFATEKIDGILLLQLTEEILAEDFKLSKLQVKKLMQFINGWRPKV